MTDARELAQAAKSIEEQFLGLREVARAAVDSWQAAVEAVGFTKPPGNLARIMRGLAYQGISVSIRIDADSKRFTLTSSDGRTCETGCPYEELVYWWGDKQAEIDKEYNARPRSGEIDWDVVHKSKLE